VVGAGIAGLHCAYCLQASNVEVQVYEAQDRVGGRILTAREVFPSAVYKGQTKTDLLCELGAEFIGSNDACMLTLARMLDIVLEDLALLHSDLKGRRYLLNGTELEEEEIRKQFEEAIPAFTTALQQVGQDRARIDSTSLADWIAENLPSSQFSVLAATLSAAFRSEFGLEPEELSALNLSALIRLPISHGLELFERRNARFRAAVPPANTTSAQPGMDQFATKLHKLLQDRVHLESRLTKITLKGDRYSLLFERPNGIGFETEAEHVVLALPFSVLREIDLSGVRFSAAKRKVIAELGYGTASKLAAVFDSRPWRIIKWTGDAVDETRRLWDAALRGNSDNYGLLAAMVGGKAGLASEGGSADDQFEAFLTKFAPLFEGMSISGDYVAGSAVRFHWPTWPYSLGSASCYRPGQWALQGSEGRREGNVHFCGEHCSIDFQGRLEGAAETGAMVAAEIINDLSDVQISGYLTPLLELKAKFEQPYEFDPTYVGEPEILSPLSRVKQVGEAHDEFVGKLGSP
jgi:monoamine oxidase